MPTILRQAATNVADCTDLTISTWFRIPSGVPGDYSLIEFGDISRVRLVVGLTISQVSVNLRSPSGFDPVTGDFLGFQLNESAVSLTKALNVWHHLLVAVQWRWTNAVDVTGPWPFWIYLDGASVGFNNGSKTASASGDIPRVGNGILVNGCELGIPHWNQSQLFTWADGPFQMADFQAWFGTYINPSVAANFAKFVTISNGIGRPVNPAVARAAFGKQTFLLTGNKNQFSVNRGSGGGLAQSGALNNFTPIPSYA